MKAGDPEFMAILNIFANFFIDTPERFLRMQDSFKSFRGINANKWIINVRGRFAEQTVSFLRYELDQKLVSYSLHSKEGWFNDTRQMLAEIDGDYVLFWLEDHICMCGPEKLDQIVHEMKLHDIDQLIYTWWQDGLFLNRYHGIEKECGSTIEYFEHNLITNERIQQNQGGSYLISAASILRREFFTKIILADDPIPKRWPRDTPFDFEKSPIDIHWLPFRVAVPMQELFASIDDDHGVLGYCLQSRALYPIREGRTTYTDDPRSGWKRVLSGILRAAVSRDIRCFIRRFISF